MRTYLVDEDGEELAIDLLRTHVRSSNLVDFELAALQDNRVVNTEKITIRKIAGNLFSSSDGVKWEKIAKQSLPKRVVNVDRVFRVFRGYKPSGLLGSSSGELLTKMPGKVVEISVSEGDTVSKGQKLLVLEAMKMENEVKSNTDGIIKRIHVKEGDALEAGVLMIEMGD